MDAIKLPPGEKITRAGVYDLSMAEYHGQPTVGASISSSGLRTIWSRSPAHYWVESPLNPKPREQEERPHFSIGRAAHHLLYLGRKGFDAEFAVRPTTWSDWRSNAAKEWKAEQLAAGMTIITDAELENIAGMARSLAAHPLIKAGILDGAVERSLIWPDNHTGAWLKSRPDCIPNTSGDVADLKTCESVATDSLQRSMGTFHYPMQAALCGLGMKAVLDIQMQSFSFVWVEKTEPWCVRVTTMTPDDLVRGRMQVEASTRTFAECVKTGVWPGPGGAQQDAEYLGLGSWAQKQIDERLELLNGGPGAVADRADELHMELS